MKTVLSSMFEVAHLWAHQLQEEAYLKGRSFYFIDDVIYSYGSHYPIAQVVSYKGRKMYVLNTDHYSNSTSRHCSVVDQSVPHNVLTFHVTGCVSPSVKNGLPCDYASAMDFIGQKLREIYKLLDRQSRARTMDYRDQIISGVSEIAKWIDFWELGKSSKWLPPYSSQLKDMKRQPSVYKYYEASNYDVVKRECLLNDNDTSACIHLFSLIKEIFNLPEVNYTTKQVDKLLIKFFGEDSTKQINAIIKKAKARYKRRNNKLIKLAIIENEQKLKEWQSNDREHLYIGYEFCEKYGWDTALRIRNNHIETSKDISLSFEEAHRLWLMVKAFEKGKKFQHDLVIDMSDHKWKLDDYRNHVLFAGCHSIPFSECKRIAKIMNW